jgi:hypothetical protein
MNPTVQAAIIAGVFGLIGAALGLIGTLITVEAKCPQLFIKGSGHVGKAVFKWMNLSKGAQKKLARSQFIGTGETGHALMTLVNSAKKTDSILAICGYKGGFSEAYYKKNFENCRVVSRAFSYEAIRSEITVKKVRYALDGLIMHLDKKETYPCDVEVKLIEENKFIKDVEFCNFDPPLSFGLAILRDGNDMPKKAVVHWEVDAKPLKDLIDIEGVIIDDGQEEVLGKLVKLREAIDHSRFVKSSKKDKEKDRVTDLCAELEKIAKSTIEGKA